MSIKVMVAVWEADLPSSEKFVLLALADHARDDGSRVYPSIRTIALKTGFDRRTVQRIMRKLQERGILSVVKKSVRYGSTEYIIRGDLLPPLPSLRGGIEYRQGRHIAAPGAALNTGRGGTKPPESSVEPSFEPSENHTVESGKKGSLYDNISIERYE